MLFILMGYCMLHLTTEITGIDFANDFHIHSGERFVVVSGDLQLEIGNSGGHGYHILFKNNGHVISDLHGVKAEDFNFNMKDHSLNASFLIDPMAPFHELDVNNHPNFFISMHAYQDGCDNCVHGNPSRPAIVNQVQAILSSATEASVVPEAEASVVPEAEASVVPEAEASVVPEAEASVVPEAEASVVPEAEASVVPEAEASVVPEAEASVVPEAEASVVPEAEASVVPEAEASVVPEAEASVVPEAEASVVPEAEASVVLEAEALAQNLQQTAISSLVII
uniref:Tandem repeat protein 36 n=1 Tax=Ehrlichia canis TaxID=944 RepID=A0A6C0GZ30_EHRCA|nr:tandem repeat protein 36 [Ehrlichia canis]